MLTEAVIAIAIATGQAHWQERHVTPWPHPRVEFVALDPNIQGFVDEGRHSIVINRMFLYGSPRWFCEVLAHEMGHTGGARHTLTGLMAPRMSLEGMPWRCRKTFRT